MCEPGGGASCFAPRGDTPGPMTRLSFAAPVATLLALAACSGPTSEPQQPVDSGPTATATETATAPVPTTAPTAGPDAPKPAASEADMSNDFTAKLFVPLATVKQENVTISGTSVRLALGLVSEGARGATQSEMLTALSFPASGAAAPVKSELAAWKALVSKGISIKIANRLFADKKFSPVDAFLASAKDNFDAGLDSLDFTKAEPSRKTINDWVKKATENKIAEILPQGAITNDTRMVVTNAVHFLGTWSTPFDAKATKDAPFLVKGATEKKVPTMHRTGRFAYAEVGDVSLAELPYGDGKMTMVIALPRDKAGLPKVLAGLKGATLASWRAALEKGSGQDLELALPKFELSWGASVKGALDGLGMRTVFTDGADLSGISTAGKLAVTDVFHKTYVRVDEKGTEAAGATGVVVGVTSLPPPPKPFVVDHPFVYAIVDKASGRALFLGAVVDPSARP